MCGYGRLIKPQRQSFFGVGYGLTPAEIALVWHTAPARMSIPPPAT